MLWGKALRLQERKWSKRSKGVEASVGEKIAADADRGQINLIFPPPFIFVALSEAADAYFTAIQKIGEQALQSSTSQILGNILLLLPVSSIGSYLLT